MRALVIATLASLGLVACSKSGEPDKAAAAAPPRDAVVAAWKDAKLTPSALTPATVTFGKDCQGGTVEGVDVLLCNFASAAEAKAAEDARPRLDRPGHRRVAGPRRGAGRARRSPQDRSERPDDQPADEAGAEVAVSIACRPCNRCGRRWPTKRSRVRWSRATKRAPCWTRLPTSCSGCSTPHSGSAAPTGAAGSRCTCSRTPSSARCPEDCGFCSQSQQARVARAARRRSRASTSWSPGPGGPTPRAPSATAWSPPRAGRRSATSTRSARRRPRSRPSWTSSCARRSGS